MTQTTTIIIDIAKPNIPAVIYAKQHDKDTRKVEASLYNNGQEYTIPASTSGQVNIAKPDGTGCYYDVDSMSENVVTFTLVEQALAADGTAKAEVSLFSTENDDVVERLTSFSFDIIIEKRVIEDSTLVSSDYYNALLGLAETVQRSVTFTPSVNSNGLLTWSNDGGLTNPESVNIKGPRGEQGIQGPQGEQGIQGPAGDIGYNNAGSHNSIYRGKNLGSSVTTAQYTAISSGSFTDMYIGDYWQISSRKYIIADFDYYLYGTGSGWITNHHIVIVTEDGLGLSSSAMNSTASTSNGYKGSALRSNIQQTPLTTVRSAFGNDHIMAFKLMLNTGLVGSNVTVVETDCYIELLSESLIFGNNVLGKLPATSDNTYINQQRPLSIMRYSPYDAALQYNIWLQDIVSSTDFVMCRRMIPCAWGANSSGGVRLHFCVK